MKTGEMLYRVDVEGFEQGPVDRHGCPSHGIGLTPDESEIWVSDGHNSRMHVFDAIVMPPRQIASLLVRDEIRSRNVDDRHRIYARYNLPVLERPDAGLTCRTGVRTRTAGVRNRTAISRFSVQAPEFGAGPAVVRHLDVWKTYPITRTTMLANYLKIAVRNLLLHPGYFFINIAGLTLGLTCCLLIFPYVALSRRRGPIR